MTQTFITKNRILYGIWLVALLMGLFLPLLTEKGDAILYLNQFYNTVSVAVFTFATRMGEWIGFVFPLLYLVIFKPVRYQVGFLIVGLTTLVLVYFFKQVVYPDAIRPIVYFESLNIDVLNRPTISLNRKHSFPSGHTTAGYAYFFFVALCADKRVFKLFFFACAFMVGFSRIFLVQHFVSDVFAGSTLGVAIATTVYYRFIHKSSKTHPVLDKTLFGS